MEHYTAENTSGYTNAELAALNEELESLLREYTGSAGEWDYDQDETDRIRKQHADMVARR